MHVIPSRVRRCIWQTATIYTFISLSPVAIAFFNVELPMFFIHKFYYLKARWSFRDKGHLNDKIRYNPKPSIKLKLMKMLAFFVKYRALRAVRFDSQLISRHTALNTRFSSDHHGQTTRAGIADLTLGLEPNTENLIATRNRLNMKIVVFCRSITVNV